MERDSCLLTVRFPDTGTCCSRVICNSKDFMYVNEGQEVIVVAFDEKRRERLYAVIAN